jgi:hypothetical protein
MRTPQILFDHAPNKTGVTMDQNIKGFEIIGLKHQHQLLIACVLIRGNKLGRALISWHMADCHKITPDFGFIQNQEKQVSCQF